MRLERGRCSLAPPRRTEQLDDAVHVLIASVVAVVRQRDSVEEVVLPHQVGADQLDRVVHAGQDKLLVQPEERSELPVELELWRPATNSQHIEAAHSRTRVRL